MGYLGNIITGAGVGILAIAAAPITGGGSLLAGATLATSLAGAGVVATAAGAAGGLAGAAVASYEEDEEILRTKAAKEKSFADGMEQGKVLTVEELKKITDFYLATTALSYYVARCDGHVSLEEEQEIEMDLNAIKKNIQLGDGVKREMQKIIDNKKMTFAEVVMYLDKIDFETLKKLENDVDEIIKADVEITKEELLAKEQFTTYLRMRG